MSRFWNVLIKFIVPVILIVLGFRTHVLLGVAVLAAYLAIVYYRGKTGIYAFLGNQNYKNGKPHEALMWMEKAAARRDCRAVYLIGYSYLLLKRGHLEKSAEIMERIQGMTLTREEQMDANSNYSLLLWKQGKLDEATAKLEAVYEDYKNTNVYSSLGYFYIAQGDMEKALAFNLEAYEYSDSSPVILDNLGQTRYLRGELEEAMELYEKLHAMHPSFPEAYYNYGLVLEAVGRKEEALEMMNEALSKPISLLNTVTRQEIDAKLNELSGTAAEDEEQLPEPPLDA